MKQLTTAVLGILLLTALSLPVVYSQSPKPSANSAPSQTQTFTEEFSFLIKDFKFDHQGETNTLDVSISYRYVLNIANSEYPDFRLLVKDVETLLTSYPNEDDYWEIVNKKVTSLLLNKYPALTSITCDLKVAPSRLVAYTRSSRVTRERPRVKSNRKRS